MDRLAVIWSSPPIAHGPFAVMRALPEEDKGKIENYLVALSAGDPAAYDMLDPFYGGGYAPVDPQDYTGLETLLAENSRRASPARRSGDDGRLYSRAGQPPEGPVTTPAAD